MADQNWTDVFRLLFDNTSAHVALIALDGTVLAVNPAWEEYGRENGLRSNYKMVGSNYLSVCESAAAAGYPGAAEAYVGLLDVLATGRPKFTMVYPCHTLLQREWYRLWIEPQTPSVPAIVIAHRLVAAKPHVEETSQWDQPDDRVPPADLM